MSGMGETLCDVENPKVSLGLGPAQMATGTKGSIAGMTKATGKRGKMALVVTQIPRKTDRNINKNKKPRRARK
jgi:hypothetical protein